jgi:hypothetical protein
MKTNDTHESVSRIAGRGLVLVGLLAVALAFAPSSFAQSNAAPAPKVADAKAAPPSASSVTAQATKAPRGMGEGIQIHGWWTIEIRNRDGSVARHVEFENALVGDGPAVLSYLLSSSWVPGSWELLVSGTLSETGPQGPCSTDASGACYMVASGSGPATQEDCTTAVGAADPQPFCYANLTTSLTGAPTPGFSSSSLTLSGQAYADFSTNIVSVQSLMSYCVVQAGGYGNSPSACYPIAANPARFTEYDFYPALSPSPNCGGSGQTLCEVPVQAGQVIAASVTFSFSSPSGDGQSATPALARPQPILRTPASTKLPASTPVTH